MPRVIASVALALLSTISAYGEDIELLAKAPVQLSGAGSIVAILSIASEFPGGAPNPLGISLYCARDLRRAQDGRRPAARQQRHGSGSR